MADKEALQTELNELYAARTKLLTGSRMESGGHGDSSWRYTSVDMNRLEARIRTLESQLGINPSRQRRAFGVSF